MGSPSIEEVAKDKTLDDATTRLSFDPTGDKALLSNQYRGCEAINSSWGPMCRN
jgi:hypothetical protein